MEDPKVQPNNSKVQLSLDLRIIIYILLLVIAGMLAMWRPWSSKSSNDRTVQVSGEAKVTAEPDEFIFSPSYEIKNSDQTAALIAVSKKSDEIVTKLKSLGVSDKKIKTNSSGTNAGNYYYPIKQGGDGTTYTLSLTITLDKRELSQKVQDYLITTSPLGSISPQTQFSDSKRKELENNARDQASKDARSKADQSAKNLGYKIGKIKSITDGPGFGIQPIALGGIASSSTENDKLETTALSVQPGENDLTYTVTVVYFIK